MAKDRLALSFAGHALRSAALASGILATAALGAGAIRLLPWMFDSAVPWRVAAPFARGLASIAIEAAVLVGWPVGWALATSRLVESGEALVMQSLGERPSRTALRLAPQALFFGAVLASVALVWGRDANEPGRVATELIEQARASCAAATKPTVYAVPFTQLTWLCAPPSNVDAVAGAPGTCRLVGSSPAALAGLLFSAKDARIAGDFRQLELDDARLVLSTTPRTFVHVGALRLRGLAPWSRASTLPYALRAVLFASTGFAAALLAVYAALRGAVRGRIGAIIVGASGPLSALALLRLLERTDASLLAYATVLPCALAAAAVCAAVASRLPHRSAAASNNA